MGGGVDAGAAGRNLAAYLPFLARLRRDAPVERRASELVDQAFSIWARPGFETMVSLPRLRFEPFPYQLKVAGRALRHMRGRAILADEVGLGKTIEAALVLSELRLRALADQALILAPPGLLEQWREELERKFAIPAFVISGGSWEPTLWNRDSPVVIASLAAARRSPLKDALVANRWDLVIIDEAHHVKSPRSATGRMARALGTRYLLLLTATPVENSLDDLFHMVSLVRPGHFGSLREFRSRHGPAGSAEPARELAELQSRAREVMIRNRRGEVELMLPRRLAETLRVAQGPDEADVYRRVTERVRDLGRAATVPELSLRNVQHTAGSSPLALAASLDGLGWHDLAERAAAVRTTEKSRAMIRVLRRHLDRAEKVIVFTAFRRTLEALVELIRAEGYDAAVYHGGLARREKDAAIRAFESELPILLTTEAAGEGRNLQFCHVMVNYDLPWNPMRIEQRLGRIHRIGQEHDVMLTNLVAAGTVEDRVLRVLEAKINLFELVVGELDMILGRLGEDFDFETSVFRAHVQSRGDEEFADRLEALGEDLARARTDYMRSRRRNDDVIGEADAE
jgi:SNF2 family DNA or RNA helicase